MDLEENSEAKGLVLTRVSRSRSSRVKERENWQPEDEVKDAVHPTSRPLKWSGSRSWEGSRYNSGCEVVVIVAADIKEQGDKAGKQGLLGDGRTWSGEDPGARGDQTTPAKIVWKVAYASRTGALIILSLLGHSFKSQGPRTRVWWVELDSNLHVVEE